ncbi:DNA polymerase lambda-like [Lineus longissimus]|uniref:DNA polymerase lambda-like n=1 Tax=Lineus longissimus TaxID=88925 RepID=UPI00315D3F07
MQRGQDKRNNKKRGRDDVSDENPAGKRQKQPQNKSDSRPSSVNVQGVPCIGSGAGVLDSKSGIFCGLNIFILEAGIGKTRRDLFGKQIKKNGGDFIAKYSNSVSLSHIVVDEKMDYDRMCNILKVDVVPEAIVVVKSTWISSCLKVKKLMSVEGHELRRTLPRTRSSATQNVGAKPKIVPKDEIPFKFSTGFGDSESKPEKLEGKEPAALVGVVESTFDKLLQSADLIGENTDDSASDGDVDEKPNVPGNVQGTKSYQKKATSQDSDPESDYVPSGDEDEQSAAASGSDTTPHTSPLKNFPTGNWICSMSSKAPLNVNHNEHVTAKLEQMATLYQNTNDKWRAFSYSKAVTALKRHPKKITTWKEAKAIPGVGAKLADKIWEIAESGELRKLNELSSREDVTTMSLFMNLWGAGPTTARKWMQMGLKTLDDLRERGDLTKQQKIGLAHYDDFVERMPREEAGEIEVQVKRACHEIDPGLIAQACGSYRRGKATCGDVDILVTHPDGKSHRGVFGQLLTKLRDEGFITDDLVSHEQDGNQKKYLGVCKLPGEGKKYRRLDIIVIPYDEYACALVYFTGSAHFNRSLRHLAKKNSMSLNEHALCVGVVRKGGEKIHKGTSVPTPTEESVFKHFGLKYRPPEERDH